MGREKDTMFHEGHRALQDRFDGRKLADALERLYRYDAFGPDDVALIEGAEFFFLATAHQDSVDCSFKGGAPGFVRVTGPTTLEWDDYDGNSMYRSLGNLTQSPRAGLLFIRFGERPTRLRVNGPCRLIDRPEGGITVRLEAREIFPNCPRYIPDLATGTPSPYISSPKDTGRETGRDVGPKPAWKGHPDLAHLLPIGDPHSGENPLE